MLKKSVCKRQNYRVIDSSKPCVYIWEPLFLDSKRRKGRSKEREKCFPLRQRVNGQISCAWRCQNKRSSFSPRFSTWLFVPTCTYMFTTLIFKEYTLFHMCVHITMLLIYIKSRLPCLVFDSLLEGSIQCSCVSLLFYCSSCHIIEETCSKFCKRVGVHCSCLSLKSRFAKVESFSNIFWASSTQNFFESNV